MPFRRFRSFQVWLRSSSEDFSMPEVILKQFETPDEVISFEKGRFEKITLGGMTIGRAVYEPGWKWSTHNKETIREF
jgi:hypothetical protein